MLRFRHADKDEERLLSSDCDWREALHGREADNNGYETIEGVVFCSQSQVRGKAIKNPFEEGVGKATRITKLMLKPPHLQHQSKAIFLLAQKNGQDREAQYELV